MAYRELIGNTQANDAHLVAPVDTWDAVVTSSSYSSSAFGLRNPGAKSCRNTSSQVSARGDDFSANKGGRAKVKTNHNAQLFLEDLSGLIPTQSQELLTEDDETSRISNFPSCGIHAINEMQVDVTRNFDAQPHKQIIELYDKFRPRLLRYIQNMYLSREQAEEVIQETFMRLTTEFMQKSDIANVQGWIVRVAHNQAVDLIKKKERDSTHFCALSPVHLATSVDPSWSPEEKCLKKEQIEQIEAALLNLNPQKRQCYNMRVQGFRYRDIGLALGISEQRAALIVKQVSVRLAAICG
jgi:RNA polymerase sigma-70 factor (ECF subfamily)